MRKIIFILVFTVIISCKKEDKVSKQAKSISTYLSSHLNHKFNPDDLYVFLPTNSCSPCLKETVKFLINQEGIHKRVNIIFIGYSKNELKLYSLDLNKKYNVLIDYKNMAIKTGVVDGITLVDLSSANDRIFLFSLNRNFEKMKEHIALFLE